MLSSHLLGFTWLYGNYFVKSWFQPFIKSIFLTQKRIWNEFVQWTINCTLGHFSRRDENLFLCWNLYTKVCSSFICSNSKQEITQMSFSTWVAEQTLVHLWQSIGSVQFSSVAQSCPALWDPINCSMPGLPVHHQLPEFTQTHVHRVSDAIQPSHPLSSPSLPAPNPSHHQGLFQWVNSSREVAKVLEFQPQHQSFQ